MLGLGEDVTCTFVNDDDAPSLTLVKQVVNDNGGLAVSNGLDADGGRLRFCFTRMRALTACPNQGLPATARHH